MITASLDVMNAMCENNVLRLNCYCYQGRPLDYGRKFPVNYTILKMTFPFAFPTEGDRTLGGSDPTRSKAQGCTKEFKRTESRQVEAPLSVKLNGDYPHNKKKVI